MDLSLLEKILKPHPAYRLKQVEQAVYGHLISSWDEASNLPKDLLKALKKECPLEIRAVIKESKDKNSLKALLFLKDGEAIETVLMKHKDGRNTVCVSSQAGCPLACAFCATGEQRLKRNLTADELAEQIILFSRLLIKDGKKVTNVVFMGMGEPFLNYNELIKAIRTINHKDKLNIGARHISISTSGITEGIEKLANEPWQINLAISLHAPCDELRTKLMPINRKYHLKKVLAAVKEYLIKTNRRVMIEYLMLKGINDSERNAEELAKLLKENLGKLFFINLISYNATGKYKSSSQEVVKKFKSILEREKIKVVQRYRFGQDIEAACGQLRANKLTK